MRWRFAILTTPVFAAALAAASAAPLESQRLPVAGDWSISAQLFDAEIGTVFGLWRMMTDRLNAGLEVEYRRGDSEEVLDAQAITRGVAETSTLAFGPSVKLYGMRTGPVSPYARAKFQVGWVDSHLSQNDELLRDTDTFNIQGSLAIGAEWYPVRQVAFGFHTGFQYLHSDLDVVDNVANLTRDRKTDTFGTFRSGIELHLFFR